MISDAYNRGCKVGFLAGVVVMMIVCIIARHLFTDT